MTNEIIGQLPCSTTHASPKIKCVLPKKENANGAALLIFPGGGYYQLVDHEGTGYANYFSQHGYTCFVVEYRLGSSGYRHPSMLEDALAALYTIRSRAEELAVSPNKIGLIGSSAGGHLVASALTLWDRYHCDTSLRPDFGVLCYPVIKSQGHNINEGSIINLLGEEPTKELLDLLDCHKHVTKDTPPCFIWSTGEDKVVPVENSLAFAGALSKHGVSYDLHIYDTGAHGLGLDTPYHWEETCLRWLKRSIL